MSVKTASDGGKVYVSNGRAGTVSVLDSRTYELLNTIKVGDQARVILAAARGVGALGSLENRAQAVMRQVAQGAARKLAGETDGLELVK